MILLHKLIAFDISANYILHVTKASLDFLMKLFQTVLEQQWARLQLRSFSIKSLINFELVNFHPGAVIRFAEI